MLVDIDIWIADLMKPLLSFGFKTSELNSWRWQKLDNMVTGVTADPYDV